MTSLSMDSPPPRNPDQTGLGQRKGRRSTREKIERLVSESAKNYPAYLKLIYTGDSEHSSEEENNADSKCEAATVTVGCPSGAGQPSMKGVVSPESEKLLDPGKEKPMTPIEPSEGTDEDEGQTTAENSAETTEDDGISNGDDAKHVDESENSDSQQNIEEKWRIELFQLQDDIVSLKAMLSGKLQVAAELKQRLGISPMAELKHDLRHSLRSLKESGTFAKTNALLRSMGAFAFRKMGTIRNSVVFKSVEEKVSKVKSKSMVHLKSKLHRKLPASKSESHVGELQTTGGHLAVFDDSVEDSIEADSLTNTSSLNQRLSSDIPE